MAITRPIASKSRSLCRMVERFRIAQVAMRQSTLERTVIPARRPRPRSTSIQTLESTSTPRLSRRIAYRIVLRREPNFLSHFVRAISAGTHEIVGTYAPMLDISNIQDFAALRGQIPERVFHEHARVQLIRARSSIRTDW